MKEIKWLAEQIREELDDAEKYTKAAFSYKEKDRDLGRVCTALAEEELNHANKLHGEATRIIKEKQAAGVEAPASMQAVWDWEHEHMIERVARIRHMLALYNS